MSKLQAIVDEITTKQAEFMDEVIKGLRPNQSAAKRARKLSLELDKLNKQYRRQSVNFAVTGKK